MKQAVIHVFGLLKLTMQLGLFGSFITNLCIIVSYVFTTSDCGGLQQQIILQLPHASFVIPYFMFLYDRVLYVLLQPHLISHSAGNLERTTMRRPTTLR